MKKKKQATYNEKELDVIVNRIINGVIKPQSMQRVKAFQPRTLDDYLAEIFGEEGYDYDYDDEFDDCDGDCEHCPYRGDDTDNLENILESDHIDDDFYYDDAPLYILDFRGENMNFAAPVTSQEASQRMIALAERFTQRQLRVVKITSITSPVGGCLRVHFNTDNPDEDYLYIFMTAGSVLTFGPDASKLDKVAIAFHQECDGLSAREYDI